MTFYVAFHRVCLGIAAGLVGLSCQVCFAVDLVAINFEAGSVGAPGSPINGWEFSAVGAGKAPEIGSTGRNFITGTNDEALYIKPFTPGESGSFSGGPPANYQGVVFRPASPLQVPAGSNVYMVMEHFGDFADGGNALKYRFAAGVEGNGSQFLGFDGTSNDTFRQEVSYELRTDATERSMQGQTRTAAGASNSAEYFREAHWDKSDVVGFGAPLNNPVGGNETNNFLDRSYEAAILFRPQPGGTDMETRVANSVGGVRVQDGTFNANGAASANNQAEFATTQVDYIYLAIARYNGQYDGPGGNFDEFTNFSREPSAYSSNANFSVDNPITNPTGYVIDNAANLKLGVKSLRFGIAAPGDFNIDGVVDAADKALAMGNMGLSGATFFDGDNDNDGDVDADDLAIFNLGLAGDYNNDGAVDAADYTVWRDTLGGASIPNETASPGVVDAADYNAWRANFGAPPAPVVGAAVPEPTALVLIALTGVLAGLLRRN
ncbi:hypothetical protein Pla175_26710 [Pirellulimonas nuda]|uniref:PEP-CTERM protein-sorting domain-containing protein n=1 Tax=Pirellulimonas nuda TaxID=2528009 RepID=A0A518DCS0_9BACT|nr:hypothetical protein [Pirellulimonas nuda]QDU89282.1 hypothetical protein Pla175_26710 [Pirellulimonas nuda]